MEDLESLIDEYDDNLDNLSPDEVDDELEIFENSINVPAATAFTDEPWQQMKGLFMSMSKKALELRQGPEFSKIRSFIRAKFPVYLDFISSKHQLDAYLEDCLPDDELRRAAAVNRANNNARVSKISDPQLRESLRNSRLKKRKIDQKVRILFSFLGDSIYCETDRGWYYKHIGMRAMPGDQSVYAERAKLLDESDKLKVENEKLKRQAAEKEAKAEAERVADIKAAETAKELAEKKMVMLREKMNQKCMYHDYLKMYLKMCFNY
jgi:hypothetical protein